MAPQEQCPATLTCLSANLSVYTTSSTALAIDGKGAKLVKTLTDWGQCVAHVDVTWTGTAESGAHSEDLPLYFQLACEDLDDVNKAPFHGEIFAEATLPDPRNLAVGSDMSVAVTQDAASPTCRARMVVSEAVGGALPFPQLVDTGFHRTFTVTFEGCSGGAHAFDMSVGFAISETDYKTTTTPNCPHTCAPPD